MWSCKYESLTIVAETEDGEETMTVSADGQHIGRFTVDSTLEWDTE